MAAVASSSSSTTAAVQSACLVCLRSGLENCRHGQVWALTASAFASVEAVCCLPQQKQKFKQSRTRANHNNKQRQQQQRQQQPSTSLPASLLVPLASLLLELHETPPRRDVVCRCLLFFNFVCCLPILTHTHFYTHTYLHFMLVCCCCFAACTHIFIL